MKKGYLQMDCTEAKNRFWDYLEEKHEDENPSLFKDHLRHCVECQKEYALLSDMIARIREERIVSPNPFFVEKTMGKIFDPQPETMGVEAWILSWLGVLKPAFAAMAIIISIAAGIYLGLPAQTDNKAILLDSFAETYGLRVETADILFD
jgi:predicted anti-sigma-YlaC factor YlaD